MPRRVCDPRLTRPLPRGTVQCSRVPLTSLLYAYQRGPLVQGLFLFFRRVFWDNEGTMVTGVGEDISNTDNISKARKGGHGKGCLNHDCWGHGQRREKGVSCTERSKLRDSPCPAERGEVWGLSASPQQPVGVWVPCTERTVQEGDGGGAF